MEITREVLAQHAEPTDDGKWRFEVPGWEPAVYSEKQAKLIVEWARTLNVPVTATVTVEALVELLRRVVDLEKLVEALQSVPAEIRAAVSNE